MRRFYRKDRVFLFKCDYFWDEFYPVISYNEFIYWHQILQNKLFRWRMFSIPMYFSSIVYFLFIIFICRNSSTEKKTNLTLFDDKIRLMASFSCELSKAFDVYLFSPVVLYVYRSIYMIPVFTSKILQISITQHVFFILIIRKDEL